MGWRTTEVGKSSTERIQEKWEEARKEGLFIVLRLRGSAPLH